MESEERQMNYLKYKPSDRILEVLGSTYWEVWQGLPDLPFEEAKSRGNLSSMIYEKDGNYIWVPHEALWAHKENPDTIFLAMMGKTGKGKINAKWLCPEDSGIDSTIQKAMALNRDIIEKKIKAQKQEDKK
jgi:hypothetical protein